MTILILLGVLTAFVIGILVGFLCRRPTKTPYTKEVDQSPQEIEPLWVADTNQIQQIPPQAANALGILALFLMLFLFLSSSRPAAKEVNTPSPPKVAKYLLSWLPKKHRDNVEGDLDEEYLDQVREYGVQRANARYWGQVLMSWGPLVWSASEKLIKLKALGDIIRRFIS